MTSIFTYKNIIPADGEIPNPGDVMILLLINLILILGLITLLARRFFQVWAYLKSGDKGSRLQRRIIMMFSLVTIVPTILVSIFSVMFFNFGIHSWFNQRVNTVLEQSVNIAESYVAEHKLAMNNTALSIAEDLSNMYYELVHNPQLFQKALNALAEMRSLNEALVFQSANNTVLAQTSMSFSLAFATIPTHLMDRADKGDVVEVTSDPTKIRMLVKLREYNDTYLLIGRLIDDKIIDYIDKTNGAAQEYMHLKGQIYSMQIKFIFVFIVVAILLLLAAIGFGVLFASQIAKPIRYLVNAAERVKEGDLSVRVSEGPQDDEIGILSLTFNKMINQLEHQKRDLAIAERSAAWADVARRVAHEIKNPLTPIQLSSERLLSKYAGQVNDTVQFKKYVNTILRHTNDIGKIVAEFVNFTKLPNPVFEKCELVSIIKEFADSRALLNDKIIYTFTSNIDSCAFICDTTQINQVLVNLCKNAEEALEHTKDPRIEVILAVSDAEIILEIKDNGKGFPQDFIDKATEAYHTTRTKGMGLGLAIVKKIIQEHCASLEITNLEPGAMIRLIFDRKKLATKLT